MNGRSLAVILARGGSKGCPGKNTAPVGGKPCILWTIEAALAAEGVTDVAVSSDDPAALAIARDAGVVALPRPAELASDTARVDDAARQAVRAWEALHELSTGEHVKADAVVILYANAPIRPAGLIDEAVAHLWNTNADSVQSYTPVGKYHPWWEVRLDANGGVHPWEGDVLNHGVYRRQDLPPAFVPDGGVLVVTRRALLREIPGVADGPHAFFGIERRGVLTAEGSVVDIDTPVDQIVADTILRLRQTNVTTGTPTGTSSTRAA